MAAPIVPLATITKPQRERKTPLLQNYVSFIILNVRRAASMRREGSTEGRNSRNRTETDKRQQGKERRMTAQPHLHLKGRTMKSGFCFVFWNKVLLCSPGLSSNSSSSCLCLWKTKIQTAPAHPPWKARSLVRQGC